MRIKTLSAAIAAVALFAGTASAATINNGSFEASNPTLPGPNVDVISSFFNPNGLPGWTVSGGSVDLVSNGLWQAADGNNSLDMNGARPGTIWQDITGLVLGQTYDITFAMAGNPFVQQEYSLGVVVGNVAPGSHTFNSTGQTTGNMGWVDQTYTFTANAASMRLTFFSETLGFPFIAGPTLDNVRITEATTAAVPLPATGLLLIGALGALGIGRRRRRA